MSSNTQVFREDCRGARSQALCSPAAILDNDLVGKIGNRLQAIMNMSYLLGSDSSIPAPVRLSVTQLQSEVAMLQRLLTTAMSEPGR